MLHPYIIEMEVKYRQHELDKELKRIQLSRNIRKSPVGILSEPHRKTERKDTNIRDYWIRFLYRVATGNGKAR